MERVKGEGWILAWIPVVIYAGTVFYLSSLSHPPQFLPPFFMADKLLHGVEYALFGMLMIRAIERSPRHPRTLRGCITLAICIVLLYGISDELHQAFVPYRDASVFDLMADVIGGSIGVIAGHKLIKMGFLP